MATMSHFSKICVSFLDFRKKMKKMVYISFILVLLTITQVLHKIRQKMRL